MASPFLIPLAAQAIGTIANRFLRPKPKFPRVSTGRIRGLASARLATQNALTQANIKQAGAAGRLPSGAIASSLAGVQQNVIDPNLDTQAADIERFNAQQTTNESLASQQSFDEMLNFNLAGAGTLAKLALLRKYGFLGGNGGGGGGIGGIGDSGFDQRY